MTKIRDRALGKPPRCLNGIFATPAELVEDRESEAVALRVGLNGDFAPCKVMGYDLRAYNPSYEGPPEFISPLYLELVGRPRAIVFDSDIHGYHGEMDSSAKLHGKGEPQPFTCPNCQGESFFVRVQFDYSDACYDLLEDEPDINIQDYFCNFMMAGTCSSCGTASHIADMDL